MEIRKARTADHAAVRAIHLEAFPTSAEANLVDALCREDSAILSLVSVVEERITGHVMFSRMRSPSESLGLAPVAVLHQYRRRGIAAALIREGLAEARASGWKSVFVLGEPTYYERFGFDRNLAETFSSVYAGPHLMALRLQPGNCPASGVLEYARPFDSLI
jgi:putative acetyltransferase